MRVIDTVLIKVASRCNLNCSYCYVYHMGDEGWREQPKRMDAEVSAAVASRLGELARSQDHPLSVVLHGGEPLMLGRKRLSDLFEQLRAALPASAGLHVQTNGVLLDSAMIDLCLQYDVGISISLDGPEMMHDAYRRDHRGRGSHSRVLAAVELLRNHRESARVFSGILAVVDPRSNPDDVYGFLKETGSPSFDFLYRDGNYDRLPHGKATPSTTEYGAWMVRILDLYIADQTPPRIRILDDLFRLLLGGVSTKEGVGLNEFGILVIDTDGGVSKNDTLKSAQDGADRFATRWSVLTDRLVDIVAAPEFAAYHELQTPTAAKCLAVLICLFAAAACPPIGSALSAVSIIRRCSAQIRPC
jgi:uncharacterized protein